MTPQDSLVDGDLLELINNVAPIRKVGDLSLGEILSRLKKNNPQLVTEAQSYALSGYTIAAICNATSLGLPAIEAILSEEVSQDLAEKFKETLIKTGQEIPNRPITYADIRTSMGASRRKHQVSLADSTTKLRTVLVNRALDLMNSGHGTTLREVISALRVVGVPAPGSVTESPALADGAGKVPAKFIVDENGRYAPNPEYQIYLSKGKSETGGNPNSVVININASAYMQAGSEGVGSVIDTDDSGNIIGVTRDTSYSGHTTRSLQSMSSSEMHKLAFGKDKARGSHDLLTTQLDHILETKDASVSSRLSN